MKQLNQKTFQLHNFLDLKATKILESLAQEPIDLTAEGVLTEERIANYVAESCGYKLLYATERVNARVVEALQLLAEESQALEKMKQQQVGDVVNFVEGCACDNRPVLHTATRDFFDYPQQPKPAKEAASKAWQEVEKLKHFTQQFQRTRCFENIIFIGIGGSCLGPQAHFLALEKYKCLNNRVLFIDNVAPNTTVKALKKVDLKKTLVLCVSKSGTTASQNLYKSNHDRIDTLAKQFC